MMTTQIDQNSTEKPVITMSRVFDAPRDVVWKAWTDPKHVMQWWGGEGFTSPVCEMDVRVGGAWHQIMQFPDGTKITMDFVYTEVDPPKRLSWRNAVTQPNGPPSLLQTLSFEDLGDGRTKWDLVALAESFEQRDIAARMGFAGMVTQGLDRLAKHLAAAERV
ncbi:SRPBCC family protein [Bradyrhizobium sp. USDA 3262]|jgi:uncharacterized protein YndB with AHSA1/START domain